MNVLKISSFTSALISAAQRRTGCSTGDPNNLGFNALFFEQTSFVRQRKSHKLAAQVRDTDSNLVRRMDRGLEKNIESKTKKKAA
jgi:hypothetical protein